MKKNTIASKISDRIERLAELARLLQRFFGRVSSAKARALKINMNVWFDCNHKACCRFCVPKKVSVPGYVPATHKQ